MFGDIKYHDFLRANKIELWNAFTTIDMDLQQYMVIKGIWYIHLHDPKHLHNKYI
jgi:hypothetical protein